MTNGSARPTPPRRASGLLLPLTVAVIGAAVGGLTAGVAAGVLWGLIAAAALIVGLRLADIKLVAWETALVAVGFAVSTTLTVRLLPEALEILTPWLSVRLAGVWLLSGLAIGVIVMRRSRPTTAANVALLWAGAGALIGPLGVSLGVIDDGMDSLGTDAYVVASLIVVLIGGSAAISAVSGVRSIVIGSTTLMITWFAASQIGFTIGGLVENFANIANVPDFWPGHLVVAPQLGLRIAFPSQPSHRDLPDRNPRRCHRLSRGASCRVHGFDDDHSQPDHVLPRQELHERHPNDPRSVLGDALRRSGRRRTVSRCPCPVFLLSTR